MLVALYMSTAKEAFQKSKTSISHQLKLSLLDPVLEFSRMLTGLSILLQKLYYLHPLFCCDSFITFLFSITIDKVLNTTSGKLLTPYPFYKATRIPTLRYSNLTVLGINSSFGI